MEKASKWLRNFLTGKKEEKYKIDTSSIENKIAESPKVKRRWSFGRKTSGRITGGKVAMHRFSRSFDSGDSAAKLQIQPAVQTHQEPPKDIESAAATKIQAAFRTYLARKALHALRGLVKIQALVRGHLVRKQTCATLRGMHALMAIQVRARIHRVQTAEEADLLLRKHSFLHRGKNRDRGLWREYKDSNDMSVREMLGVMESRSGRFDHSDTEHVVTTLFSEHLKDPKRKYQYKENPLITEPSRPGDTLSSCQVPRAPNYLTKTESSRAKARSFSEPKQRPKRGTRLKSKSTESTKDLIVSLDGRRQSLASHSSRFNYTSLDHWVINHYESLMDSISDSFEGSTATSDSYR